MIVNKIDSFANIVRVTSAPFDGEDYGYFFDVSKSQLIIMPLKKKLMNEREKEQQ